MKALFCINNPIEFYNDEGRVDETFHCFWFINHYTTFGRHNGRKLNQHMFL